MKKLFILFAILITTNSFAFYNFDKVNYYFDKQFEKLQGELEEFKSSSFKSSNSSMRYFDEKTGNYVIKIRTIITKQNLNIKTHKNYIIISGKENQDGNKVEFNQTMSLPSDADTQNIKAEHKGQILTINIPRLKQAKQFNNITIN